MMMMMMMTLCSAYEEADEFCPRCDNHYVLPAKTPQIAVGIEGDERLPSHDFV
jgi:hypothetical protein